jgi:hypothetical protein
VSTALAIPDASSVSVEQASQVAAQIEAWCSTVDDVAQLEDARAKVAAIETYLRRTHASAAVEIARADRKLEVRIGSLLAPPAHGGDRHSDSFKSGHGHEASVPRQRATEFRKMAEAADVPEVAAAIDAGASRSEVLRQAAVAEAKVAQQHRRDEMDEFVESLDLPVPDPAEEERGALRVQIYDAVMHIEEAAHELAKFDPLSVTWAAETFRPPHMGAGMRESLAKALAALAPYMEVAA